MSDANPDEVWTMYPATQLVKKSAQNGLCEERVHNLHTHSSRARGAEEAEVASRPTNGARIHHVRSRTIRRAEMRSSRSEELSMASSSPGSMPAIAS